MLPGVGLEAAHVDFGGWDTHAAQGTHAGSMFTSMTTYAEAIAAFHADVVARDYPVTLVTVSEFGRHVAENGSLGTDHGRATALLALGRQIAGGRVLMNRWPGLAPEQRFESRDLAVTTDFRNVFAEVVTAHLGAAASALPRIIPGYAAPKPIGVIKG